MNRNQAMFTQAQQDTAESRASWFCFADSK
jgi:hypothetical protein